MTEKIRRDIRATAGETEDLIPGLAVAKPLAEKKLPNSVLITARISRELLLEIRQVANDNGVKPASLIAYGIAYFMRRLKADPAILKFDNKRELRKG